MTIKDPAAVGWQGSCDNECWSTVSMMGSQGCSFNSIAGASNSVSGESKSKQLFSFWLQIQAFVFTSKITATLLHRIVIHVLKSKKHRIECVLPKFLVRARRKLMRSFAVYLASVSEEKK